MKAYILFGAPGSGKGTTAERIRDLAKLVHVSTGDMLRDAVKKGTEIGREAESFMKKGELVPDSVIIRLVEARMDAGSPDDAYLFDGFPRTIQQADLLAATLARRGGAIDKVFFLDAPRAVLIERLTGRRACRKCGTNFHIRNIPPKQAGICDRCGGELYQRPDDKEATIVNRLEVYAKETESLISRYVQQGVLAKVDSSQQADKLASEILGMILAGGRR